jgi:hypothetical protein
MTWRDKPEMGLKDDAPTRKDNVPSGQIGGLDTPAGPGRFPDLAIVRGEQNGTRVAPVVRQAVRKRRATIRVRSVRRKRGA